MATAYRGLFSASRTFRGRSQGFLLPVVGDDEDMRASGVMSIEIPEAGLPDPVAFQLPAVQQALLDALD
jgi:hypothetical protein